MKKRVLVPLAPGFEEVEALTVVDYLRRADMHVVTASVGAPNPITGRSRIRVMADIDLDEALAEWGDEWDAVVLPGGAAVDKLLESEAVVGLVARRLAAKRLVGAICAAPRVLVAAGLAAGARLTSYPSTRAALGDGYHYMEDAVVTDGALVTSRGPGTSVAFALALIAALAGPAAAEKVARDTVS